MSPLPARRPRPPRDVKINDVIVVKKDEMTRTFKVLQLLQQRVGARRRQGICRGPDAGIRIAKARASASI